MVSIIIFLMSFLFPQVMNCLADTIPYIPLKEGNNEVYVSIKNNWDNDITNLKINFDKETLPEWLTISGTESSLTIRQGMYSTDTIKLVIEVGDSWKNNLIKIPYTLTDSNNNLWNLFLNVRVISENSIQSHIPFELLNNFPNPFNPITTITYSLSERGYTKLFIHNVLGQTIRTLVDEINSAGFHSIVWDGCDDFGQKVSSGLYFYTLTAGTFIQTKRMMLLE